MEKGEEERKEEEPEEEEPRTGGAVCKRSVQCWIFFLVNLSELMDQVDVVFLLVFFLKMREF